MATYCITNKIPLDKYIDHSLVITKSWMKHVREHNVSLYCLMEYQNLEAIINNTPKDEVDLLLDNIYDKITLYRNRYRTSKAARKLVQEGIPLIREFINKEIKSVD